MTTHKTPQEAADEKRMRDDDAYEAMMHQVEQEFIDQYRDEGGPWPEQYRPDGTRVHKEAMRRLRENILQ